MELTLTEVERQKYDRQIRLWGEEKQINLKKAKIGLIGTGGLGSPILLYLAVAGVGKIILADKDRVELSNLNRQVLHWNRDVGKNKPISAQEKLKEINPDMDIVIYCEEVGRDNIEQIFQNVDVVIDGLDNFPTRFILNEYAVKRRIPLFHGAIWGLEGRATTIIPGKTLCLHCFYKEAPPKEIFPVAGVTPGLIGIVQVTEVIKYFTQTGELLLNQLLLYDGETMTFRKIPLKKDPRCPVCAKI